jgi:hypothetical protein
LAAVAVVIGLLMPQLLAAAVVVVRQVEQELAQAQQGKAITAVLHLEEIQTHIQAVGEVEQVLLELLVLVVLAIHHLYLAHQHITQVVVEVVVQPLLQTGLVVLVVEAQVRQAAAWPVDQQQLILAVAVVAAVMQRQQAVLVVQV